MNYAPNSDVAAANDTANGTCAAPTSGTPTYSYTYDRFGNRWNQTGPQTFNATFTGNDPGAPQNNNRMDGYSYDTAGNLLYDGTHHYTYDGENHILTVDSGATATYAYDSDGNRVQKTSTVGSGGDPAGTWEFIYDESGRMVQRFNGALWQGNIYVGSRHIVEDGGGTNFSHADWLGTERVRTTYNGTVCESIASLPFGDGQTTTGACYHSSPLHFTGKERDAESGLDNFGARYMASTMGRFMSPDWSAAPKSVPYADFGNPQSLNLYSYVKNNPVTSTDPDGHCTVDGEQHGWLWCAAHWAGITETKKEAAAWEAEQKKAMAAYQAYRRREIAAGRTDPAIIGAAMMMYGGLMGGIGAAIEPEPSTGGIEPVLKGQAGVNQAIGDVEAEGGQVLGTEITIENSAGRARADFVYKDAQGNLVVGEAKNGPTAGLNSNQQAVYSEFEKSGGRFVGGNAQQANLPPSVGPTQVRIFKY